MRKLVTVPVLLCCAASAFGQSGPAACASSTPDGVPCLDPSFGVVVRFSPPVPVQKLPPLPSPSPPVVVPEGQTPKFTPPSVPDFSEYWAYRSDGICDYHRGMEVQHYGASTLQDYVDNGVGFGGSYQPGEFVRGGGGAPVLSRGARRRGATPQRVDTSGMSPGMAASYQVGEAIGSVSGAAIREAVAHHRRVVWERSRLRSAIGEYYRATFTLTDQAMREQDGLATDFARLAELDPAHRGVYERGAKNAVEDKARFAAMRPAGEKMLAQILETKNVKHLRSDLALAEKTYQAARSGAGQEYVFSRFVGGLTGHFESEQMKHSAPAPSATPPTP
jgi:hypothetical protein